MLFEIATPKIWWDGVDEYEKKHKGYRQFIEWLEGVCYPRGYLDAYRTTYKNDQRIVEGW